MGSPEKPLDVEMGDMDETKKLNPNDDIEIKGAGKEDVEQRFTGLKKDELLEISSQKKWVVARWILFILFWAAWIGMLVGAIIIVIKAPRCKAEPTPPWYQDTVVYQADVRKFAGDLEGMTKHVDYVKSLKAKTLTVCHANDPRDLTKVVGNSSSFKALVAASHESDEDKNVMVVVDLRIDALSTSSDEFLKSANVNCSGASPSGGPCSMYESSESSNANCGGPCLMFLWQSNDTVPADGKWIYHAGRGENYKVVESDVTMAYVNYAEKYAFVYVKTVVRAWIANEADGFQLRDMSMVGSGNASEIVEAVQMAINESQADVEADEKKVIGLFLLGSNSATQGYLYPEGNDTDSAAVVINTALSKAKTALDIKNAITSWRKDTEPFIGAYAVNTMDMTPLAERLGPEKAAGLSLFSYSLPGVPVVRSGDEALLADDNLTWNTTSAKLQIPNNASLANIKTVGAVGSLRVDKHRALRSLRWDNEDATFEFVVTNDTNVIAIRRKWDTKPTVLAIYNPSDDDLVVELTMKEDDKVGEVLASSDSTIAEGKKYESFDAVSLKSGLSLLLEVKAK